MIEVLAKYSNNLLQCINVNQHIVHLKLAQCYVLVISVKISFKRWVCIYINIPPIPLMIWGYKGMKNIFPNHG